ncbi:hypothetical protein GCM10010149_38560 [Nonomuraea roseoviolacea subsp. roseoviolacea]|uniref:Peptidase S8/S53 domain-containing protein n=1 Tax=Nonomuraea roseoviolacea subsp. carminata TaxID=160689 RepID=A0ABT1JUX0_9ACTN|nr:S8 family serine peptidase [Nonomuraea roseoviolacea]MCP2345543.1 hypothetical protein [Nonomuraea roseoviolacea subsp. carminata]
MPYAEGATRTDRYLDDQLVAETRDEGPVLAELEGFLAAPPDRDLVLGLTRVQVGDLSRFPFDRDLDQRMIAEARAAGLPPGAPPPSDLDRLLFHLRDRLRNGSWVPRMAKVRMHADGLPYTGGLDGNPRRLAGEPDVVIPARSTYQGPRVRVGILDGAFYRHPALAGHYLADSAAFGEQERPDPPATMGHAVHLAGIVARQAPGADIVIRQALNEENQVDSWALAKAMVLFRGEVDILLTALGGTTWDGRAPFVLERAESRLGCLHVASAGNWGLPVTRPYPSPTRDSTIYPAALPGVIAVGALDEKGERAPYSQSAPWISLMAPGEHDGLFLRRASLVERNAQGVLVVSAYERPVDFGGYASWSGTSAAAAYATGALAALVTALGGTAQEAAETLLSGDPGLAGRVPATGGIRRYSARQDAYAPEAASAAY